MGNIWGVATGAFIIYMIQHQGLKQLGDFVQSLHIAPITLGPLSINLSTINFLNYQYLLYGLALVIMMLVRPEGLFPSRRRRRELHADQDEVAEFISAETLEQSATSHSTRTPRSPARRARTETMACCSEHRRSPNGSEVC